VTPFASRAVQRGIAAVVVSMVRQRLAGWNPNTAAQIVDVRSALVQDIRRRIAQRAAGTTSDPEVGAAVEETVQSLLDDWGRRQSTPGARLAYRFERDGTSLQLLLPSAGGHWKSWTCANSLRETEPSINLLVEPGGDGREQRPWVFRSRTGDDATQAPGAAEPEPSEAPA
jgi:hypothetical protein